MFRSRRAMVASAAMGLALAAPAGAEDIKALKVELSPVNGLTTGLANTRGKVQEHRLAVVGTGRVEVDGRPAFNSDQRDVRIVVNLPLGTSAGDGAALRSPAEAGHARACLDFARDALRDKTMRFVVRMEASVVERGQFTEGVSVNRRDELRIRASRDRLDEIRCTLTR